MPFPSHPFARPALCERHDLHACLPRPPRRPLVPLRSRPLRRDLPAKSASIFPGVLPPPPTHSDSVTSLTVCRLRSLQRPFGRSLSRRPEPAERSIGLEQGDQRQSGTRTEPPSDMAPRASRQQVVANRESTFTGSGTPHPRKSQPIRHSALRLPPYSD